MNLFTFLLIFVLINGTDIYILSPKITLIRVFSIALIIYAFSVSRNIRSIPVTTRRLMIWAFILIFYKFILYYSLHFSDNLQPLYDLLIQSACVLILPTLERLRFNTSKLIGYVLLASIPSVVFGVTQINNSSWVLENLIPANTILFTGAYSAFEYLSRTARIVGTYNDSISFSLMLGIVCIILWAKYIMQPSIKWKIFGILGFAAVQYLVVFTQTRSAIYGIIPSILIAFMLSGKQLIRKTLIVSSIFLVLFVSFSTIYSFILDRSERSKLEMDVNTYHKLAANIYSVYGILRYHPLFGIKKAEGLDTVGSDAHQTEEYRKGMELIRKSRQELGRLFGTEKDFTFYTLDTNHNVLGYYIRYYGLIGLVLFIMTMLMVYRKVLTKTDMGDRYMLLGIFIYLLQFSLLHNTRIMAFYILWVLLSCGGENGKVQLNNGELGKKRPV